MRSFRISLVMPYLARCSLACDRARLISGTSSMSSSRYSLNSFMRDGSLSRSFKVSQRELTFPSTLPFTAGSAMAMACSIMGEYSTW